MDAALRLARGCAHRARARLALLGWALAIMALLARPSRADAATVAVVHEEGSSELQTRAITRLKAELAAAGFGVTEIVRGPGDARHAAEAESSVPGAFATIAIVSSGADAADIWIADRITGKTVVRRVQGSAGRGRDVAAILAVRAVELLQASLLEAMDAPSHEEQPTPQALPNDVSEWMQQGRSTAGSRFRLGVGGALLHSFGDVGAAFLPVLGISYDLTSNVALSLRAGAQAFASNVDAPVGSIGVRQELAWLDIAYRLPPASARLRPLALIGAGVYHVDVVGTARAPYEGRTDALTAAAFNAGLGASYAFGSRVSLVADVRALLVTPRPVIRAAGEPVGRVSQPALLGELALVVGF